MPAPQSASNYSFYYPPHHFVFLPLGAAFVFGTAWCAYHYAADRPVWLAVTAAAILILFLAVMMRQHYALGNQDRIVRLEMRLQYYQLTGNRFDLLEDRLSFGQIAALRFAGDEELLQIIEAALSENLSPDAIRQRIKTWMPDMMRV